MKQILLLFLCSLAISCSTSNSEVIDGMQTDTIQQSVKEIDCDFEEQSVSVSTKGKSWIISSVFVNGKAIAIGNQESMPYTISQDWFSVVRTKKTEFSINITKNTTGKIRKLEIVLSDKNFYTYTVLNQKSL